MEHECNCSIFVVYGVLGGVRYDGVGKGRFPIYVSSNVCGGRYMVMSR